jgi:nucleotide-binding universal stress UspA family protein
MKKIIAAFDGLKYSESTEQYAIYLTHETGVLLAGVFLEDFTYRGYKLFDMVGSEGVSPEKVKQLMDKDKEARSEAVKRFQEACQKAHIKTKIHRDKSLALQELLKESIYADLLIINQQESLSHYSDERPTRFITDLLVDIQCPVLVVPNFFNRPEHIILLYDGNPSSVYAARMFSYMLPQLKNLPIEVLSVESDRDVHTLHEPALIKEFIDCHFPGAKFKILRGDPEREIVSYLEDKTSTLVVLGAYKRGMVSRWFRASMADILMEETNSPLFVAHYK